MSARKITDELAKSLAGGHGEDWLELVVELEAPPSADVAGASRADKIAARKEAFALVAGPLAEHIRGLGGEVTGEVWLNNSMRARVAKRMAPALSANESVKMLDLPRQLKVD